MIFLGLIIFLVLILSLGHLLLLFWPEVNQSPRLALAFALGGSVITWQLFIIKFIFHLPLNVWSIGLFVSELIILAALHYRRGLKFLPRFTLPKFDNQLNKLLFAAILLVILLSLLRVFTNPLLVFDALATWAYRVKILYYHQADLFNPESLTFWANISKSNYPWHLSLLSWFQTLLTGTFSNTLINFLPWCCYAGLLAAIYALAKDKLSQTWSLALTLLVATMPLLFYHSYSFYADLPLAFYIAVTCLVWRRWLVNQSRVTFLLSAVLAGCSLLVKSEAIFFIAPLALLSLFKLWQGKSQLKSFWPLGLTLAIYSPWLLWLITNRLGISNVTSGLGWHPQVTTYIFSAFFSAASWHLWWYLIALMLALAWTAVSRQTVFKYCFAWLLLSFSCFLSLYYFTETYQYVVDNTALSRNIIILIPLSAAVLIDCLASWFND